MFEPACKSPPELNRNKSLTLQEALRKEERVALNSPLKTQEIEEAMRSLTHTAPGPDTIPNTMIKQLSKENREQITTFYNLILRTGRLPLVWKEAHVVPLLKAGKSAESAQSYRPVALTATLCKLLEKVLAKRINYYLEKHKKLLKAQDGFRKK